MVIQSEEDVKWKGSKNEVLLYKIRVYVLQAGMETDRVRLLVLSYTPYEAHEERTITLHNNPTMLFT